MPEPDLETINRVHARVVDEYAEPVSIVVVAATVNNPATAKSAALVFV